MAKAALVIACGQIDMHPRCVVLNEFGEKTASQNVIT